MRANHPSFYLAKKPPQEVLKYGRKLTQKQFEEQIIMTHNHDGLSDTAKRRIEMELCIGLRLGLDYPLTKRSRLWLAYEEVNDERLKLIDSFTRTKRFFPKFELLQVAWLWWWGRRVLVKALDKEDVKNFLD